LNPPAKPPAVVLGRTGAIVSVGSILDVVPVAAPARARLRPHRPRGRVVTSAATAKTVQMLLQSHDCPAFPAGTCAGAGNRQGAGWTRFARFRWRRGVDRRRRRRARSPTRFLQVVEVRARPRGIEEPAWTMATLGGRGRGCRHGDSDGGGVVAPRAFVAPRPSTCADFPAWARV